MRVALLQLCASDDPSANMAETRAYLRDAAAQGATLIVTPEVTNCVSSSRAHQAKVLQPEDQDITLQALRADAAALGVWVLIGSLALQGDNEADTRFVNRSFLIGPDGEICARYDKIHMFDVTLSEAEVFRESDGYKPGQKAVLAQAGEATLGLTICYDLRFAALFRQLAQAGAQILTVPSAFHPVTGAAHWDVLLRARAIETGCFVLAPAQCGRHTSTAGRSRSSYGHSLVVSPWGEVLADGGDAPGIITVDLDMAAVESSRRRIPSLQHDQDFTGPA